MSIVPKMLIEFGESGADEVTKAIAAIGEGFEEVAKKAEEAAKGQEGAAAGSKKAGDASAYGAQKAKTLWETMKANAGAAQGAAQSFAQLSAIMSTDMSPAAKTATAVSAALSTGLAAFGPIGQLAAAAITTITSSVIAMAERFQEAVNPVTFFSDSWDQVIAGFKSGQQTLKDAAGKFGLGGINEQFLLLGSPEQIRRFVALRMSVEQLTKQIVELQTQSKIAAEFDNLASLREVKTRKAQVDLIKQMIAARKEELGVMANHAIGMLEINQLMEVQRKYERQFQEASAARIAGLTAVREVEAGTVELAKSQAKVRSEQAEMEALLSKVTGATSARRRKDIVDEWELEKQAYLGRLSLAQQYQARQKEIADFTASVVRGARAVAAEVARMRTEGQIDRAIAAGTPAMQAEMRETMEQAEATVGVFESLKAGVAGFADAAVGGFAAAAAAALIYGDGLKEAVNQQLQAMALEATAQALKSTALGLAYLAAAYFGFGPGFAAAGAAFASAATWGAIAGGTALGAAATGGFSREGSGAGDSTGGGGRSPRDLAAPESRRELGPTTLNTNFVANGPMSRVLAREYRAGNDDLRRRAATGAA